VEEAAPVPSIQQLADMDKAEMIEKDDTNANIQLMWHRVKMRR
jgi:hypothetical protein